MCLFLLTDPESVIGQNSDSLSLLPKQSCAWVKPALVPAILGSAGLSVRLVSFPLSDEEIKNHIRKNPGFIHNNYDDYFQFTPLAMVGGLQVLGIKGKNNLFDESALLLISLTIQGSLVYLLKYTTHVERPDGSSDDAFPSGHTAMAFSGATFMHMEYGERSVWYSVAAYTPAVATGTYRMLRNRHWASDVLVGAACGIAVTRAVYWVYPKIKGRIYRTLHLNNLKNGITFD